MGVVVVGDRAPTRARHVALRRLGNSSDCLRGSSAGCRSRSLPRALTLRHAGRGGAAYGRGAAASGAVVPVEADQRRRAGRARPAGRARTGGNRPPSPLVVARCTGPKWDRYVPDWPEFAAAKAWSRSWPRRPNSSASSLNGRTRTPASRRPRCASTPSTPRASWRGSPSRRRTPRSGLLTRYPPSKAGRPRPGTPNVAQRDRCACGRHDRAF